MNPSDPVLYVAPPTVDIVPFVTKVIHSIVAFWPTAIIWIKATAGLLIGLSFPISLFFVIGIIYCVEQLKLIRKKEAEMYDTKIEEAYEDAPASGDAALASRWETVVKLIGSEVENDWKQAILQADIILDELLTKMGYRGESVGEKLKRVEQGDMKTLQEAWAAHIVRNKIAHEPGFSLNRIEAQQTFHLFKKVFEEFFYI